MPETDRRTEPLDAPNRTETAVSEPDVQESSEIDARADQPDATHETGGDDAGNETPHAPGEHSEAGNGTAAADQAPEPDAPAPPDNPNVIAAPPEPARAGGGGWSMAIGGAIAAALGAGAVLAFLPEGWRHADETMSTRLAALEDRIAGTGTETGTDTVATDALLSRIEALEARQPADLGPIEDRVGALEGAGDLAALTALVAAIDARLTTLESRPGGLDAASISAVLAPLSARIDGIETDLVQHVSLAVDAALAEARAQIEAQAADLNARAETVADAQDRIAAREALAALNASAESGAPAPEALSLLATLDLSTAALAPLAQGLPTLRGLQADFVPAARAALAADAPPPDAPLTDRLTSGLMGLVGARSLAPREGDSTDAILSRAEAALRAGDLAEVLRELDGLAEGPADALAGWRSQARTRIDALAALDALDATLNRQQD